MLGGGSVQLARIFGIRIGASPSWFLVLFLMIYLLSGYFQDVLAVSDGSAYGLALVAAALFFCSLVLHELGHAVVARRNGIGIAGIDLWFFGGLARLTRDTATPGEEFRVAAAGPAVTALVVGACAVAGAALGDLDQVFDVATLERSATTTGAALVGWLALVNVALFAFNLIPAFPLDGGRLARAAAWRITGDRNRATKASARLGQGFAYLLIAYGLFDAIGRDPAGGLYLVVLGWFLGQAARSAVAATEFSERLEGVTAADVMDDEPVAIPATVTAAAAQDEFFLRYRHAWFPVVDDARRVLGVVGGGSVADAVGAGRPALPVGDLLDGALGDIARVARETPLEDLLAHEPLRHLGALVVVDAEGRLCGLVTLERVRLALANA